MALVYSSLTLARFPVSPITASIYSDVKVQSMAVPKRAEDLSIQVGAKEIKQEWASKTLTSVSRRNVGMQLAIASLAAIATNLPDSAEARVIKPEIKRKIFEKLKMLREKANLMNPNTENEEKTYPPAEEDEKTDLLNPNTENVEKTSPLAEEEEKAGLLNPDTEKEEKTSPPVEKKEKASLSNPNAENEEKNPNTENDEKTSPLAEEEGKAGLPNPDAKDEEKTSPPVEEKEKSNLSNPNIENEEKTSPQGEEEEKALTSDFIIEVSVSVNRNG
ncbi:hypothetical protein DCAR_0208231 [Daucus carota subsp. sativus]|uniref:Uncharacterized protein n=1 Tax=Daucus carota subsp. sativus TaxID=79200 RepID=A0A166EEH3_DAUCS|nr:PREDICTED: sporozoite surface protein 2-like isoform X1 [Daucus carota subsp. sativus]WOG88996.1 hypothetical protein DCAR_0208231 [Daucus carota subsp. sativus]